MGSFPNEYVGVVRTSIGVGYRLGERAADDYVENDEAETFGDHH